MKPNTKDWPHVTEILRIEGATNYSGVSKNVLSVAQHFGTAVHKATELSDLKILDETTLSKPLIPYLNGWKKAKKELKLKVIKRYVEMPIWSKRWKFKGQPDRIMKRNNKLVLVEIKATAQILPANALQTAFYQIGFEEIINKEIKERWIIRLKPNSYEPKLCKDVYDKDVCIGMTQSYHWKNKNLKGI